MNTLYGCTHNGNPGVTNGHLTQNVTERKLCPQGVRGPDVRLALHPSCPGRGYSPQPETISPSGSLQTHSPCDSLRKVDILQTHRPVKIHTIFYRISDVLPCALVTVLQMPMISYRGLFVCWGTKCCLNIALVNIDLLKGRASCSVYQQHSSEALIKLS